MNRRDFLKVFGSAGIVLALPNFELPEEIPATLPLLPTSASSFMRRMVGFRALGLGETLETSGAGFIEIFRRAGNGMLIKNSLHSYGGAIYCRFRMGEEIVEIPGYECVVRASRPDIAWEAQWANEDGSWDFTAGTGEFQTATTHQPPLPPALPYEAPWTDGIEYDDEAWR